MFKNRIKFKNLKVYTLNKKCMFYIYMNLNNKVNIHMFCSEDNSKNEHRDTETENSQCDSDCEIIKIQKIKPKNVKKNLISKNFKIVTGNPITDVASLINSLSHPKASKLQKEFVEVLRELDNMIGLKTFKEQLINQILFFIQDYQEPGIFLHTVLTGPPGSGKTTAANILAKIYSKLGVLKTDKIVIADRSSLVGKFLGHTAIKTKQVLESANGCVLLLDEVYSLGNKEGGDSFSKECIDTINQYLSEHVDEFICIIAGYKTQVKECFFNNNPGLERRFPWTFNIDVYKSEELFKIMKLQLDNSGWTWDIDENYVISLIKNNMELFNGNGGDTKNLLDKCKIFHARRIFTEVKEPVEITKKRKIGSKTAPDTSPKFGISANKILNKNDISSGFKYFSESKSEKEQTSVYMNSMYI